MRKPGDQEQNPGKHQAKVYNNMTKWNHFWLTGNVMIDMKSTNLELNLISQTRTADG